MTERVKVTDRLWHYFKILLLAVVGVGLLRFFVIIPLSVDGDSMFPTLAEDDFVLYQTAGKIERFDIVIFQDPSHRTYIKRVIGLPGEKIEYIDKKLYVNDKLVQEPYNQATDFYQTITDYSIRDLGAEKVPNDHYFVLGDNRNVSYDSRMFGFIARDALIGKARVVYYPLKHFKKL